MNRCDQCGDQAGVVQLTEIRNGEVRTIHLCAKCAGEKGIQTQEAVSETPLGGFLAALGEASDPIAATGGGEGTEARCPGCGSTLSDFRETGRVGCAECYQAFEEAFRELLRRLHGSTHHSGMTYVPPGAPAAPALPADVAELRERLRRAIEAEQFELAAELRDRLKERE
jgi:protein arginine kinase activator